MNCTIIHNINHVQTRGHWYRGEAECGVRERDRDAERDLLCERLDQYRKNVSRCIRRAC